MKKVFFLLFLAVCLIIPRNSFAQIPSYVPQKGLIGWWPINGNSQGKSGFENTYNLDGAVIFTDSTRFISSDSRISFEAQSESEMNVCKFSKSDIKDLGITNVETQDDYAISFWFKCDLDKNLKNQTLFSIQVGKRRYKVQIDASGNLSYAGKEKGLIKWLSGSSEFDEAALLDTSYWYGWHMLTVVKKSNKHHIYLDGMFGDKCYSVPETKSSEKHEFSFGVSNDVFQLSFDNIGLWNRALTRSEIFELRAEGYYAYGHTIPYFHAAGINESQSMYRKIENPIDIAIADVPVSSIYVDCDGCSVSGNYGSYLIEPGSSDVAVLNISKWVGDSLQFVGSQKFAVYSLPDAETILNGRIKSGSSVALGEIINGFVSCQIPPEFPVGENLQVTISTCRLSVNGVALGDCDGGRLDADQKSKLNGLKKGDVVLFNQVVTNKGGALPLVLTIK
jgi:hypothetical protein